MSNDQYDIFCEHVDDNLNKYAVKYVEYLQTYRPNDYRNFLEWCAEEEGIL